MAPLETFSDLKYYIQKGKLSLLDDPPQNF